MKKIVSILFLAVVSFILVSCTGVVLDTPTATLSGDTLSWDAVEGALQYYVYIDDAATAEAETTYYTVAGTSFDLSTLGLADGSYNVYVVAVAGTSFSSNSSSVSYIVGDGGGLVLDAPTNVVLTGDTLTWASVVGATGYTIFIGTLEVDVTVTTYDLSQESLAAGTYSVTVIATAGSVESGLSTAVSYVVSAPTVTLTAPANVVLTGSTLSWSAVTNATGYTIFIGTLEVDVTGTSYNLVQQPLAVGTYSIHVVATAGTVVSPNSTSVSYTVVEALTALEIILTGTLPIIDDTYELDMVEADFDYSWEYESYQETVAGLTIYAQAAIDAGLMPSDAINFFDDVFQLIGMEEPFDDVSSLLAATDIFVPNNITAEVLAHLAIVALGQVIPMSLGGLDNEISYYQSMVTNYTAEVAAYFSGTNVTSLLSEIAANTPVAALTTAAKLTTVSEESITLLLILSDKLADLNELINDPNDYYYRYGVMDEDVDNIILIADAIYASNPTFVTTIYSIRSTLYSLDNAYWDLQNYERSLNSMQILLDRANNLVDMMDTDAQMFEDAFAVIFDFVLTLRESFPANTATLLDGVISGESELTLAEIVLIKNELVALVTTAMPTEEDFQMFYEVLLMVGEVALDNSISDLQDHADYLGSVSYNAISLELLFIGSFEVADVEAIQQIVSDLQTAYEFSSPIDDPTALLNALIFIQTYFDEFVTENSTQVAALESLLNATAFEPLFQEILTQLAVVATDQNPQELDMILYILDSLSNEYDNIFAVLTAIQSVGTGLIAELIDSEASILTLIGNMQNMDNPDLATIVSTLETLIDEIALYHGVLVSELTTENIQSVLSLLIVPAMAQTGMYTDPAFEAAMRALIPDVATVLMNVASLEQDVFDGLNVLNIGTYINMTLGYEEPVDLGSALAIIHLLDGVLTVENETMIDNTVEIVFTTIFGNATLQSALGIDPQDVTDQRTNFESILDELITNIHAYAALDIAALTFEQEKEIMLFADQFNLYIDTDTNYEDGMTDAMPMDLDTLYPDVIRTDRLFYAFVPTESGYYTFTATFNEEHYAMIDIKTMDEWINGFADFGTTVEATQFMAQGQTYYIIFSIDDIYVDVSVEMTAFAEVTDLVIDVPVDLSYTGTQEYFKFVAPTFAYYQIVIDGSSNADGDIQVLDQNGHELMYDTYYMFDQQRVLYYHLEENEPIFIEIFPYYGTDTYTLTVSSFVPTELAAGTPETIGDETFSQYFVFMLEASGPYQIVANAPVDVEIDFYFGSNDYDLQNQSFYLYTGDTVIADNFLRNEVLYVIRVDNISVDTSIAFELVPVSVAALSTMTPAVTSGQVTQPYYYEFVVDNPGFYQLDFTAGTETYVSNTLITTDGWQFHYIDGWISLSEGLSDSVFLVPGTYFGALYINDPVAITITLTMYDTPIVYANQEIYVTVMSHEDYIVLFTPQETGQYVIYSYNDDDSDPYVDIYSPEGYQMNGDDDNGGNWDFELYVYLEAGQTYSIYFSNYQDSSYPAMIEFLGNN